MNQRNVSAHPASSRSGLAHVAATWLALVAGSIDANGAVAQEPAAEKAAAKVDADPAEAPPAQGLATLVRIGLPLSSGADTQLKLTLTRARDRLLSAARTAQDARRPILVLEISPSANANDAGAGSQFEAVLSLARFLSSREMAEVKTVAWLPRSVRGHGVLAAIACEEIVMAPDAEIGEAGIDESKEGAASPTVVAAYREIADAKRTIPVALAEAMIDPAVEVLQVESEEGVRFLLRSEVEEFRRDHEVINEQQLVAPGTLARFTGREGRQFGFVKYLAGDRDALAQALSVPRQSLEEDQSLAGDWHAVVLDLRGEITRRSVSEFNTFLGNELSRGANLVAVRIDSVGGDLAACVELAAKLSDLEPNLVRTVAYVPVEARGGAALVALSCDQLAMHADATLGAGLEPAQAKQPPQNNRELPPPAGPRWRRQRPQPPPVEAGLGDAEVDLAAATASIRDFLAAKTDRSWSLLAATIDPTVEVFEYRNKLTGQQRLLSVEEAGSLADAVNWTRGAALNANNQPLALTGVQAVQKSIAWQTVDNFDQLERAFAVKFRQVEPNWALTFVQTLASPGLATFLLFLGFIGIWVEIKTPGVGVGGMVAAVAFVLFFWSKYLDQTANSLEILMFVFGLVLVLLEIFVLPGFGIFGLSGALMIIFSLVLASQTMIIPTDQAGMDQLRGSIATVAGAGVCMIALALATRHFLPKAPLFNRLVLEPPPPEERITQSHREALADYAYLVGVPGEAATDLRPAGKALIDNHLIDVVAEGMPIDRGAHVVVVSAHAHRVVVREA